MFNLKPNQILIEWTDNKNNIPIKLTETIDFFLLNDGLGTICFYNQLIKDFQKILDDYHLMHISEALVIFHAQIHAVYL